MPHNELSALRVVSFSIYNNPRNPSPLSSPCTAADTWCLDRVWVAQGWQTRREPEFKPTQSNLGGCVINHYAIHFPTHTSPLPSGKLLKRKKQGQRHFHTSSHYSEYLFFQNFVLNVWMNETSPPYILSISLTLRKRKRIQLYLISFLSIYKIWKGLNDMNVNRIIVKTLPGKV